MITCHKSWTGRSSTRPISTKLKTLRLFWPRMLAIRTLILTTLASKIRAPFSNRTRQKFKSWNRKWRETRDSLVSSKMSSKFSSKFTSKISWFFRKSWKSKISWRHWDPSCSMISRTRSRGSWVSIPQSRTFRMSKMRYSRSSSSSISHSSFMSLRMKGATKKSQKTLVSLLGKHWTRRIYLRKRSGEYRVKIVNLLSKLLKKIICSKIWPRKFKKHLNLKPIS